MAKLFANSGDPDQTPRSAVSDLGLHCLPITLLRVSRLQCVNSLAYLSNLPSVDASKNSWINSKHVDSDQTPRSAFVVCSGLSVPVLW